MSPTMQRKSDCKFGRAMAPTKVLITGVTGYIGGTILSRFLSSDNPTIKDLKISVLTRNDERAKYFSSLGLKVYTIESLDDSEAIRAAASENDIVIHTASGYHTSSAKALIEGKSQPTHPILSHTNLSQAFQPANTKTQPQTSTTSTLPAPPTSPTAPSPKPTSSPALSATKTQTSTPTSSSVMPSSPTHSAPPTLLSSRPARALTSQRPSS